MLAVMVEPAAEDQAEPTATAAPGRTGEMAGTATAVPPQVMESPRLVAAVLRERQEPASTVAEPVAAVTAATAAEAATVQAPLARAAAVAAVMAHPETAERAEIRRPIVFLVGAALQPAEAERLFQAAARVTAEAVELA